MSWLARQIYSPPLKCALSAAVPNICNQKPGVLYSGLTSVNFSMGVISSPQAGDRFVANVATIHANGKNILSNLLSNRIARALSNRVRFVLSAMPFNSASRSCR